jgi:hypothetical protein
MDKVRAVAKRLFEAGHIDESRLREALEIADGAGLPLLRVLLHMKMCPAPAVAEALADVLGWGIADLDRRPLPPPPIPEFTAALCRELRVFPMFFEANGAGGKQLVLAMADPTDSGGGEKVAALIGHDVRPVLVLDDAIARAIQERYEGAHTTPPEQTALLLVESLTAPPPSDEGVFAEPKPIEPTVVMRAKPDMTVVTRSPFLDPSRSDETAAGSPFSKARVWFVSEDARARLRVAADLATSVHEALVFDALDRAVATAERGAPDEIVVHAPKNDVTTGIALDRLSRALGQGVVVISDDDAFALLPCVRRRLPVPSGGAPALAPLILEGFFQ